MSLPNTFICGAPKCGTTSLAAYLADHDDVFVSIPKEPHFFNDDMRYREYENPESYRQIFADAQSCQIRIDSSALYLYSQNAIPNVLRIVPDAKFIAMLRDPVDMAYSMHSELLSSGQEIERDFRKAWNLCSVRRNGRKIPMGNRDPSILSYDRLCKLGEQVKRLLGNVDRQQVLFIDFEEFIHDTNAQYRRALRFLELRDWAPPRFERYNSGKFTKSPYLARISRFLNSQKRKLNINLNTGILGAIDRSNSRTGNRKPLTPEFRSELKTFFAEDVSILKDLIKE